MPPPRDGSDSVWAQQSPPATPRLPARRALPTLCGGKAAPEEFPVTRDELREELRVQLAAFAEDTLLRMWLDFSVQLQRSILAELQDTFKEQGLMPFGPMSPTDRSEVDPSERMDPATIDGSLSPELSLPLEHSSSSRRRLRNSQSPSRTQSRMSYSFFDGKRRTTSTPRLSVAPSRVSGYASPIPSGARSPAGFDVETSSLAPSPSVVKAPPQGPPQPSPRFMESSPLLPDHSPTERPQLGGPAESVASLTLPTSSTPFIRDPYRDDPYRDDFSSLATLSPRESEVHQSDDEPVVREDQLHHFRRLMHRVVTSQLFDYVIGSAIILNAILIGVQTDVMASAMMTQTPWMFRVIEPVFCVIFAMEVAARIFVYQCRFFTMVGWRWNVFDVSVVGLQILEQLIELLAPWLADLAISKAENGKEEQNGSRMNFTFIRAFRLLRLIRVVRVFRILRIVGELRRIATSILQSMRAFGSTVLLLFLFIYLFSVYFTQLVLDHRLGNPDTDPRLESYFGSLGASVITLYSSIAGGLSWRDAVQPLMHCISPYLGFVFSFYIAFSTFAMMNVVTGVFVESVMGKTRQDSDTEVATELRRLLTERDEERTGAVSWEQFQGYLKTKQMTEFFRSIDLEVTEAKGLFSLFDVGRTGFIKVKDFVDGCLRLRRPARALELLVLMRETKHLGEVSVVHSEAINDSLKWIRELLLSVRLLPTRNRTRGTSIWTSN